MMYYDIVSQKDVSWLWARKIIEFDVPKDISSKIDDVRSKDNF